jgi:hypothetical protein
MHAHDGAWVALTESALPLQLMATSEHVSATQACEDDPLATIVYPGDLHAEQFALPKFALQQSQPHKPSDALIVTGLPLPLQVAAALVQSSMHVPPDAAAKPDAHVTHPAVALT